MAVTNPHPWTDDDGTGTTGTPLNNAALQTIYNDLGPETTTVTSTGTVTALPLPVGVGDLTIYLNNGSLLSIKGIAPAAIDGQKLTLVPTNGAVDIYNQDTNATAVNRIVNPVVAGIPAGGSNSLQSRFINPLTLIYDLTAQRWRVQDYIVCAVEFDNGNTGTALTVNFASYVGGGPVQKMTATGNATITLAAPTLPGTVILKRIANGTPFTTTLTGVKWPNGSAPTWSSANGAVDLITLFWDGANWYGAVQNALA